MAHKDNRSSFVFSFEWKEVLMEYPAEVRLEVYDAIIMYAQSGTVVEMKPLAKMAFSFIKKQIDYNNEKYESTVEKRREAGRRGNETRWGDKEIASIANATDVSQKSKSDEPVANIADNVIVYDTVYDNDINKKDNSNELSQKAELLSEQTIDFEKLVTLFNTKTNGCFGEIVHPLSASRKKMIRARIKQHGKENFIKVIEKAVASLFLNGQNGRGFVMTFDWMIKPSNFEKILSGNFDNKTLKPQNGNNSQFTTSDPLGNAQGESYETQL